MDFCRAYTNKEKKTTHKTGKKLKQKEQNKLREHPQLLCYGWPALLCLEMTLFSKKASYKIKNNSDKTYDILIK